MPSHNENNTPTFEYAIFQNHYENYEKKLGLQAHLYSSNTIISFTAYPYRNVDFAIRRLLPDHGERHGPVREDPRVA